MVSKVFAGFTVVFWAAMMTALVRVEIFPKPQALHTVSTERVLKKVFENPNPVRLNVFYQGKEIGYCTLLVSAVPAGAQTLPAEKSYRVESDLRMTLSLLGIPSRLLLNGESRFNSRYEIEGFNIETTIGEGRVSIAGDSSSRKVAVVFDFGQLRERREFDFAQVQGAGLASAFGLPGLANFSFLGAGGLPSGLGAPAAAPATTAYLDRLPVAGGMLPVYMVCSKLGDSMWAKMWVSELGEVLKLETSMGLTMVSDVLVAGSTPGAATHWRPVGKAKR